MGTTKIDWCDYTWNPVTGCTPCSPGCEHCYAAGIARRFWGERPFSEVRWHEERLSEPLSWRRPGRVFVCSMGDLFHPDVPAEFIADVFDIMASAGLSCRKRHEHDEECWQGEGHTYLVLTKRPERMQQVLSEQIHQAMRDWPGDRCLSMAMEVGDWPLPNVWLGVTVCNQAEADAKIPLLLQTPAARRFVSIEPMLGPVDLAHLHVGTHGALIDCLAGDVMTAKGEIYAAAPSALDWVIVGGETGAGARPMHPNWVRGVRDQCQATGVPFFFKSWGKWAPTGLTIVDSTETWAEMQRYGHKASAGHLLDGVELRQFPA